MDINGRVKGGTKLLGLLGNPVAHSISPQLHNTICDLIGEDAVYLACRVEPDKLEEAVRGLRACNFLGFNITVPYKEAVIAFCDELSEEVALTGAANTVKNINGKLRAYNTDGSGFVRAFRLQTGRNLAHKNITVLGAGGTARSIAVKLAKEGAACISVVNRTAAKACEIAETVNRNICDTAVGLGYNEALDKGIIENSDIIINTTSVGLNPDTQRSPLPDDFVFRKEQTVYDVIYKPEKTKLLKDAEKSGCITANGLGMLICQGVEAFEIWLEIKLRESMVADLFEAFTNYSAG